MAGRAGRAFKWVALVHIVVRGNARPQCPEIRLGPAHHPWARGSGGGRQLIAQANAEGVLGEPPIARRCRR